MKRSKTIWILIVQFWALLLFAQSIDFDSLEHDFGKMEERDGIREAVFRFVNNTGSPVTIRDVHASCGCTTSGWSAGTIEPGAAGEVRLSYDPDDRPGVFNKSATVQFEEDIPSVKLTVTGEVIPDPEKYRKSIGHLLIKEHTIDIEIPHNATHIVEGVRTKNCCGDTLMLSLRDSLEWGTVRFVPEVLRGGEKGWMILEMDTDHVDHVDRETIWVRVSSDLRQLDGGVALHINRKEDNAQTVIDVTPEMARDLIGSVDNLLILDVRTPEEYAAGHIPGAVNVNFFDPQFDRKIMDLDPVETCLIYCKGGVRSGKAIPSIVKRGIKTIYHLNSGFTGWAETGMPVEW